jgi:hypothetical protein
MLIAIHPNVQDAMIIEQGGLVQCPMIIVQGRLAQ